MDGLPLAIELTAAGVLPYVAIALAGTLARQGRVADAAVLLASAERSIERLQLEEQPGDVVDNAQIRSMVHRLAGEAWPDPQARDSALALDDALDRALTPNRS